MAKSDIIIKDSTSKNNILKNKLETKKDKYKTKILKNKNEKQREKIYICNKCNKSYNIKNSYQKHLLTHEPKKYICTKCDSRFSVKSKLKRHLLIHSEIKEFKCSMCDSAFHLKYNLKVHMRVHNNEKPYICGYPGCFAKFAQKNNLNSHSKIEKFKNNPVLILKSFDKILFDEKKRKFKSQTLGVDEGLIILPKDYYPNPQSPFIYLFLFSIIIFLNIIINIIITIIFHTIFFLIIIIININIF